MARKAKAKPAAKKKPDPKRHIPAIIERMIGGESLRSICSDEGMPHIATFLRWVAEDAILREQYARAMELRADYHHEEIFDIADDGSNDWMERTNKDGDCVGWMVNGEAVARSKLRVDARKWSAARMHPKKYGDKVVNEHTGLNGAPISVISRKMTPKEAAEAYEATLRGDGGA